LAGLFIIIDHSCSTENSPGNCDWHFLYSQDRQFDYDLRFVKFVQDARDVLEDKTLFMQFQQHAKQVLMEDEDVVWSRMTDDELRDF